MKTLPPNAKTILTFIISIILGIAFHKSGLLNPLVFSDSLRFHNYVLWKFILSTVGTVQLCNGLAFWRSKALQQVILDSRKSTSNRRGSMALLTGAALMGLGMKLTNTTSILSLAQLNVGNSAGFILCGGIIGIVLYELMESKLQIDWIKGVSQLHRSSSALTFDKYIPMPYMFTSMLTGGMCFFMVTVLETTICPWVLDGKKYYAPFYYDQSYLFLGMKLWPAPICGVLTGLCQFISMCFLKFQLNYISCMSDMVLHLGRKLLLLPKQTENEAENSWKFYLIGGMLLGSRLSVFISTKVILITTSWIWSAAHFWGGMALFFGARLAGGDYLFHAFSGLSFMVLNAVLVLFLSTFVATGATIN